MCNPLLTRVAILLAKGAFRDYRTVDELLSVVPPQEGIVRIHWHRDFLNKPVYERGDGHIWSARTYCARLRAAGIRAGFPSINNHDFRAEGLRAIGEYSISMLRLHLPNLDVDENYTASQRRRHAGHGSDDVYDRYYAPTNPGTDGQGAYAGDSPRTLLPKLLRTLKMNHNPELAQTLPARELHELVTSKEYSSIAAKLDSLENSDDTASTRSDLQLRLRNFKLAALKKYREGQKDRSSGTAKIEDRGHYCTPFSRIRHLMPVHQRLADSLFTVATIHSDAGRAALEDLITLYRSEVEVEHRRGLEPEHCLCQDQKEYVSTLSCRYTKNIV